MNYQGDTREVTARKPHRCDWCGESIIAGSTYLTSFIVCEGGAWRRKLHPECAKAELTYDYDGDILYYEGQFERGHNHEPNWTTTADGVEAGCPGCKALEGEA
jgi:hypothetical protein